MVFLPSFSYFKPLGEAGTLRTDVVVVALKMMLKAAVVSRGVESE